MTLISFGRLYVGLDDASFQHIWRTTTAWIIHFGRLRLEWDCIQYKDHGPITEDPH